MHWNWYGLATLHKDVMAAMYAVNGPPSGFELGDDFFAGRTLHDTSGVI